MTIQQAFLLAVQHHQAGRLAEAEAIYRQIVAADPRHADALHLLGVIAHQMGRNDVAVGFITKAIAIAHGVPGFHSNLGNALKDEGQLDEAIAAYRRAIALKPVFHEAHNNLGNALKDKGQLDEAIAAYSQAIALKPDLHEAHNNLGTALRDKGQFDEAIAAHRQAITLKPNYAKAHNNLGNALLGKGQLDEAIAAYRQAIILKPDYPEAHYNLGTILRDVGQLDEAVAAFRHAIAFKPEYPEAHNNLGNALKDKRQSDEAIAAYRQAITVRPTYTVAHNNLGNALLDKGHLDDAVAAYGQAIAFKPDYPEAHSNLGMALKDKGLLDEAIVAFRRAIVLKPHFPEAHSNLLLTLNYHPGFDARAIAGEQRCWNQQHAEPLGQFIRPHVNDRTPERPLRIGYVSGDFREHVVGWNILPLLACHNRGHFEIFCYAQVAHPDALTERFHASAHHWRNTTGLTDEKFSTQIRVDQIDVLVDLALHTTHNRLLVFARKPAPVQVTWLGYPGSTGLSTIDYRLSDPYFDPPGADESAYSEQTIRLPETYWCYQPDSALPEVSPLPVLERGVLTFGCLNNFCKVSEPTLATWARVMRAMPNSRLLLHAHEGSHRQGVQERLAREGIEPTQVQFAGRVPRMDYFRLYREIDIALDTFPYGGGTTTCDALWMGVPVVSLVGKTAVGRAGLSILSNIGLPELVAHTEEDFVTIATQLAGDLPRLAELRRTLRARMEASVLMDAPRFARNIEAAYRAMWRKWCGEPRL